MQCFLCKKSNFATKYVLKTKKILHCKNDGLVLAQIKTEEKLYGKEYFNNAPFSNYLNNRYFLEKIKIIKSLTKVHTPTILDVGCGWGDFEEVLEKERIPYLGIDVNKEAIEICRKKGLNCKQAKIQQFLAGGENGRDPASAQIWRYSPPVEHLREGNFRQNLQKMRFDAITMFQVIEHLKNPLPTLQSAKKLLKKNGILLITTPNNDSPLRKILGHRWSVYTEPSHYVFFNKDTLEKTLQQIGLKNIVVKNDNWRFLSSQYVFNRLTNMYSVFPLTTIFKLLTTINIPLPTDPFGDLEAVAKK